MNKVIEERTKRTEWYRDARFGMFIHWGLYAIPARGEWVRSVEQIPHEDYCHLTEEFTAENYNPREWARLAKKAGMKEVYYLETQEGKNLPVPHCIRGTAGWQIREELDALRKTEPIDKETFGSTDLAGELTMIDEDEGIGSITLVGLCTDICVISNALLIKASLPEVPICVDATCCAGVTPESHENALKAMEACQIRIIR